MTEEERNLFELAGWTRAWLGPLILRAETAALAALGGLRLFHSFDAAIGGTLLVVLVGAGIVVLVLMVAVVAGFFRDPS